MTPGGFTVSIATEFDRVNDLFRSLKTGPFCLSQPLDARTHLGRGQRRRPPAPRVFAAWILHFARLEKLVRRRTADLSAALEREKGRPRTGARDGREARQPAARGHCRAAELDVRARTLPAALGRSLLPARHAHAHAPRRTRPGARRTLPLGHVGRARQSGRDHRPREKLRQRGAPGATSPSTCPHSSPSASPT